MRYDNDVPFNGDGHISMFRLAGGHVDYNARYAHTQRYKAQSEAHRSLFGTYRNRATDDPAVRDLSAGIYVMPPVIAGCFPLSGFFLLPHKSGIQLI